MIEQQAQSQDSNIKNPISEALRALGPRPMINEERIQRSYNTYCSITLDNALHTAIVSIKIVDSQVQIIMHKLGGGYHTVDTNMGSMLRRYLDVIYSLNMRGILDTIPAMIADAIMCGRAFIYHLPNETICFMNDGPDNILAIPMGDYRARVIEIMGMAPQHTLLTETEKLIAEQIQAKEEATDKDIEQYHEALKEATPTDFKPAPIYRDHYVAGEDKPYYDYEKLNKIKRYGQDFTLTFDTTNDGVVNITHTKDDLFLPLTQMFKLNNHHMGSMLRRMKNCNPRSFNSSKLYVFRSKGKARYAVASLISNTDVHTGLICTTSVRNYINYFKVNLPKNIVYFDI